MEAKRLGSAGTNHVEPRFRERSASSLVSMALHIGHSTFLLTPDRLTYVSPSKTTHRHIGGS